MKLKAAQPWIKAASFDTAFILLPPFVSLLIVWLLPGVFKTTGEMPIAAWVILILFIDVAHVYSTLFRTYFNPVRMGKKRTLMLSIPLACYIGGVLLHSIDGLLFWRILAYLAVFHFIRQQYGFMRLYSRAESLPTWFKRIDTLAIYSATIYPIIYWHCHPGRHFNWFVDGDFLLISAPQISSIATILYTAILVVYLLKEIYCCYQTRTFNLPRNLLIIGTALSWYFGIVYFNGDLAFTLLNVVAHGIPYMALIWITAKRDQLKQSRSTVTNRLVFLKNYGIVLFLFLIVAFAYIEEGLWDGLVWREHGGIFAMFSSLPAIENEHVLMFLVPLLALPQSTHYVLDAFIWRRKDM